MPLSEMSSNMQEAESCRKRSHEEFTSDGPLASLVPALKLDSPSRPCIGEENHLGNNFSLSSPLSPSLSDPASNDLIDISQSPKTPSHITSVSGNVASHNSLNTPLLHGQTLTMPISSNSAAKRKKLTPQEKAARDQELIEKKQERDQAAAAKAAEKTKKEAEKVATAKEREEKRKQKEDENRIKNQEKDERKRRKEEEQLRVQKEKEKKEKSQMKLKNFFVSSASPRKSGVGKDVSESSPKKVSSTDSIVAEVESPYRSMFKPFFVKEHTFWTQNVLGMDQATRAARGRDLDECLDQGSTNNREPRIFNPNELFPLSGGPYKRGCLHEPVKHIMETIFASQVIAQGQESGPTSEAIKATNVRLNKIPLKILTFSRDVRPPYYGTVTFKPFALGKDHMRRLARRSVSRRLPLDYEYDSEAEWQEEEGEDLDAEDDEEEIDDEDDMDGFLDDSEDTLLSRRVFASNLEPEITGVCFEQQGKRVENQTLRDHKMEFMHEGLQQQWGINPFSTEYWQPAAKKNFKKAVASIENPETTTKTARIPINAFVALGGAATPATVLATVTPGPEKLVKDEILNDLKRAIVENKALSKVGIVDVLYTYFRKDASRVEIKNTIERVAERIGAGREKEWQLKADSAIVI